MNSDKLKQLVEDRNLRRGWLEELLKETESLKPDQSLLEFRENLAKLKELFEKIRDLDEEIFENTEEANKESENINSEKYAFNIEKRFRRLPKPGRSNILRHLLSYVTDYLFRCNGDNTNTITPGDLTYALRKYPGDLTKRDKQMRDYAMDRICKGDFVDCGLQMYLDDSKKPVKVLCNGQELRRWSFIRYDKDDKIQCFNHTPAPVEKVSDLLSGLKAGMGLIQSVNDCWWMGQALIQALKSK